MDMSERDEWRRFAEIWAMVMDGCCMPMICEATICRTPMASCSLTKRHLWEKKIAAWDAGERPPPRWRGDTLFAQSLRSPQGVSARDETTGGR